MKKRPAKEPLSREDWPQKKIKKSRIDPKMIFIFIIKKQHSDFIDPEKYNSYQVMLWRNIEAVHLKVPTSGTPNTRLYVQKTLEKYLNDYLKKNPYNDEIYYTVEKEKNKNGADGDLSNDEKIALRENLIFSLFEQKYIPSAIADTFGMKVTDIYNIHAKIYKRMNPSNRDVTKKRFVVSQAMLDELEAFLSKRSNRLSTLSGMRKHLLDCFNLSPGGIAISTIHNMLKRISFSRSRTKKLIERRNIYSTIKKRKEVALELLRYIKAGVEVIYLDETGFNQSQIPFYGYSKKGERCEINSKPKTANLTVISAITKEKVLGYQMFKGGVNADDFGGFLMSLIHNYPDILMRRSKYVFFLDNAPIHRAKMLKPFLQFFQVLFNAPYSPLPNPIEEYFGNLKFNYRKKSQQNITDIAIRISQSVREIDTAILFS